MAFNITYFAPIGNQAKRGAAPQIFTYRTADTLATVTGNDYFEDIAALLEKGDVIHVEYVDSASAPTKSLGKSTVEIALKLDGFIKALDTGTRKVIMSAVLADVSTASTIALTSAVAGTIDSIITVLGGAITVANAAMTFDIGGVAITNSAITVAFAASAQGDIDSSAPSAAKTVAAGSVVTATTDGGSTTAQPLYIYYIVTL